MQALIDFLYRNPKSKLKQFRRFGGYINYRSILNARKQMEEASLSLPPVNSVKNVLTVYFLTGKDYLHQTLFCIRSLELVSEALFKFILVDDGTFNEDMINRTHKQLPGAAIIRRAEIEDNIRHILPAGRFPHLHRKRAIYPHIKKLTDIHTLPGGGWKLVMDSDMLFWHKPHEILEWLHNPFQPIHMVDCGEAYGYSKELMERLSGSKIKPLVNVGAIGLNSDTINWADAERWIEELESREGTSYYLEQTLTAMLIGDNAATVLPAGEYIVNPERVITDKKQGTLHHYVDLSKEWYYKLAWKKLI